MLSQSVACTEQAASQPEDGSAVMNRIVMGLKKQRHQLPIVSGTVSMTQALLYYVDSVSD